MDDLRTGDRLGQYEIEGVISEGGMGIVYRARHIELSKKIVALKTVLTAKLSDEYLARFKREALAVQEIEDHSNVVPILDYGVERGRPYIVMPYLRGETLAAVLRNAPLPIDRSTDLILDVCAGVYYV